MMAIVLVEGSPKRLSWLTKLLDDSASGHFQAASLCYGPEVGEGQAQKVKVDGSRIPQGSTATTDRAPRGLEAPLMI